MNLKFRFAFLFTLFVFIIQMASSIAIYLLYKDFRKEEFTKRLKTELVEKIGTALDSSSINLIKNSLLLPAIYKEEVLIYDSAMKPVYKRPGSAKINRESDLFRSLDKGNEVAFFDGDRDGVAVRTVEGGKPFYVVVSAFDEFGRRKIQNLQNILFFTVSGALLLSGLFAFLYIYQIIKPLGELNEQMQRITETNLTERIPVRKNTDELRRTAETFNAMLTRLQQSFEMRKSFVHHASHELRTPLATMLAQTEAAIKKDLTTEDYKKVLASLAEDQQDLIDLTNSLLLLSQFESSSFTAEWLPVRVDELLYETIEIFKFQQKQAEVSLDFKTLPEESSYLTIKGNHSLLISAFRNLVKNGCLYSDNCHVSIFISADETGIIIEFENNGKQIQEEEQRNLFMPFFRAENSIQIKGTGLGLSIVQRIVELHKGTVKYRPVGANLNRFTIHFPAQKNPAIAG